MKDPLNRTKVVLRHLPASLPQQFIMDQIDARFNERYDWVKFRPGKSSAKHQRYTTLYINFKNAQDVVEFAEFFNGRVFVNEKGAQFKALVEYAPSQRLPKSTTKKDGRDGTIEKDADYLEFIEQISKPVENLPSAEIQLERKEAEKAVAGKEAPIVTPLMSFIRQKRAAKTAPRVPGSITARMRKNPPILTPSPNSSKRVSERRNRGSSNYGVKEGNKEKPMYILASRKEEQVGKDRAVVESLVNDNATSSGALVGSSLESGKGKIILLKSNKGKEVQQQSDMSAPTQNPARPARGILTNKDGARGLPRQMNGDDRFPPVGDKLERSSRGNRGMWAPRDNHHHHVQGLVDPMERVSILQHGPGNGERKGEMRNHGGPRGNNNSLENGSQRNNNNNNRRGPQRVAKEIEASKRGSSSFSSQEKHVWVQKSGSAS